MFRKKLFTRQKPVSELASELFEKNINSKIFKAHLRYSHYSDYLRNRLPVGGGCVYVLQLFFCFLFFFVFFSSTKTMRQPFSGTAERIFMKLSPNDTGEM